MSGANYGGIQPNNTAYIKTFVLGSPGNLWTTESYTPTGQPATNVITTASPYYENVLIPGNLYVNGNIINPSDVYLKDQIFSLNEEQTNKLMNLRAVEYTMKSDPRAQKHFGFIAQEMETEIPELVFTKLDKNIQGLKAINYLEIIPLLVSKIQLMQKEIDELKGKQIN